MTLDDFLRSRGIKSDVKDGKAISFDPNPMAALDGSIFIHTRV
eukprot:CAMPEP_0197193616 /NCGR_PEP_ID=MMETSP1423-20130617/27614_1 /TAXON_ID=476441 /ORGANISM="Pseudo-nitzschia heimii, Strain UNC1101" /LENGTH=42 /DNA_ID= /DNA_START= /DNA_END= /DNA_ORIENTATION=